MFYNPLVVDYHIEQINDESIGFRVYKVRGEDLVLPSVTTVLGWISDNSWIEEAKENVGEEYFETLKNNAIFRGQAIHWYFEELFVTEGFDGSEYENPDLMKQLKKKTGGNFYLIRAMIRSLFKEFRQNLSQVIGIEIPLYSKHLKIAGTSDLIGYWNGELSIIDYKNTRNFKTKEECEGYFKQCTLYAIMLHERFGIMPKQIVLPVFSTEPQESIVYVEETKNWIPVIRADYAKLDGEIRRRLDGLSVCSV